MNWLRWSKRSTPRRRRSWRPGVERVEGRQLMTANLYVLDSDGYLWLEHPSSNQRPTLIDTNVQSFTPDPQRPGFVYVEGTDRKLWLEDPGWQAHGRTFVDSSVEKFAVDPTATGFVYVEGTDHNLWLEAPGAYAWLLPYGRVQVDSDVEDFVVDPYQAGYLYVKGTDHNLWLEDPGWQQHGRTWVDDSVQSFAVDPYQAGSLYVQGTDGNLWHEAPGWYHWWQGRTWVDSSVQSFAVDPYEAGALYVEGTDHNLWLEDPGWQQHGRTWVDGSVQSFAVDTMVNPGYLYVEGTDHLLWYELPGWQRLGRIYVDGAVQAFALDPSQTSVDTVLSAIRAEYAATAFETGGDGASVQQLLGQPTGYVQDVPGVPNAFEQLYQGGGIYWSAATGAHVVYGGIGAKYDSMGGPAGYGLPVGDEMSAAGMTGVRVAQFLNGADIYWSAATGAHAVYGLVGADYAYTALETDSYGNDAQALLGAPVTDEMDVPGISGARMNIFQHGAIYYSPATGAHAIYGGVYYAYLSLGGPTGFLGLPIADEVSGQYGYFQHGMITYNLQTGQYTYQRW